jgi:hypothetical protein
MDTSMVLGRSKRRRFTITRVDPVAAAAPEKDEER